MRRVADKIDAVLGHGAGDRLTLAQGWFGDGMGWLMLADPDLVEKLCALSGAFDPDLDARIPHFAFRAEAVDGISFHGLNPVACGEIIMSPSMASPQAYERALRDNGGPIADLIEIRVSMRGVEFIVDGDEGLDSAGFSCPGLLGLARAPWEGR